MKIHVIAAVTKEGVIGTQHGLPWHIPDDLKLFKKQTTGKTILMGRTTFETIGRPLPNRHNIVLDTERRPLEKVSVCGNLEEALILAAQLAEELYVIGGASVYRQMLPKTDVLHLSHIRKNYPGDVYFPYYDKSQWQETGREEFDEFVAIRYERI